MLLNHHYLRLLASQVVFCNWEVHFKHTILQYFAFLPTVGVL